MLRIADGISASASSLRRLQRLSRQSAERLIRQWQLRTRHAMVQLTMAVPQSLWQQGARAPIHFATDRTPRLLSGSQLPSSSCPEALKLGPASEQQCAPEAGTAILSSHRNGGGAAFLILLLPDPTTGWAGYPCRRATWETFIPGSIVCWIMAIFSWEFTFTDFLP